MKKIDLAWAAGFLDGEGYFHATRTQYVHKKSKKGMRIKSYTYFQIVACQADRRVLKRLQKVIGGDLQGPYGPYTTQTKPYWNLSVCSNAEKIFKKLYLYLSPVKRKQGKDAIITVKQENKCLRKRV